MKTYYTVKHALLVLCLLAMPTLTGCNTTAGFGRDIQQAGSWVEGGARTTEAWIFGSSSADAAEIGTTGNSSAQAMTATVPEARDNVVFFQTGSAEIPPDGVEMLRAIADGQGQDQGQGNRRIEVIGHSDTAGPAELNDELSRRRAEAVADALAAEGLQRDAIEVQWHGENQLPVPTEDGVPEPRNRRVSIATMGS